MKFVESVKTVLIEKYATFNGRASRSEYWWFILFVFLINLIERTISLAFTYQSVDLLGVILTLVLLIPNLAVSVRRLHDVEKSGWWLVFPWLVGAVVFSISFLFSWVNIIDQPLHEASVLAFMAASFYLFYFFIKSGSQEVNKYG